MTNINESKIKYAKSKFGRIEFRFDVGMSNRGDGECWVENKVTAILDGKDIGYLKINYIPREKFNTNFKDILKFLVVQHGAMDLEDAIKSGNTYKIIVKMADLTGERHNLDTIMKTGVDTDLKPIYNLEWWKKKYNELLDKLNKKYGKEFKKFEEYWVDKPMIDYIQVDEKYRAGGVGIGLYIAGAMWMAEKGFPLRSGYSRSESALQAWNKMKKMGLPVGKVSDIGIERNKLDYRR